MTKNCLIDVFPRTGLAEDQQKVLLEMIRPIHDLEREQRLSLKKDSSEEDKLKSSPRPLHVPPPPPFKCTPGGEVVPLTPAEIYVRAMHKILDKTDKLADRQKAQESMKEALPCMDKMFKREHLDQAASEAAASENPAGTG